VNRKALLLRIAGGVAVAIAPTSAVADCPPQTTDCTCYDGTARQISACVENGTLCQQTAVDQLCEVTARCLRGDYGPDCDSREAIVAGGTSLLDYAATMLESHAETSQLHREIDGLTASFASLLASLREETPKILDRCQAQRGDGDFSASLGDRLRPLRAVAPDERQDRRLDSVYCWRSADSRTLHLLTTVNAAGRAAAYGVHVSLDEE